MIRKQPSHRLSRCPSRFSRSMNTPNITAASTKAEIIDASCELVAIQADTIADLQERQLVLWALVGVLSVLLLLGAH